MKTLLKRRTDGGPLHAFVIFPVCLTVVALTAISPTLAVLTAGSAERGRAATRSLEVSVVVAQAAKVGVATLSIEDRVWLDGDFCEE
jgi:hypothetical protein